MKLKLTLIIFLLSLIIPLFGQSKADGIYAELLPSRQSNPPILIVTRDFSRHKTDMEFKDYIHWKYKKYTRIKFITHETPRIGFFGPHLFCALIWTDSYKS